jgi:hypothetical protein
LAKSPPYAAPAPPTVPDEIKSAITIVSANVFGCRSFTAAFHLQLPSGQEGWYYAESPQHFAIAAAAELTGKPVWFTYGFYDPNGNGPGSGLFKDVQMATFKFVS